MAAYATQRVDPGEQSESRYAFVADGVPELRKAGRDGTGAQRTGAEEEGFGE